MAKQAGMGDNIYVGGYNLSGDVGAVQTIAARRTLLDITGIDKSAMERTSGLRDGEIAFNSWFNDASDQEHTALRGLLTTDRVVIYTRGTTVGNQCACMVAKQVNYDWARNQDGSLAGTIQCLSNDWGLEWGELLTAGMITHGSATNGSSIDYGAVSTLFGAAAYLEMRSFAGTSTTVTVQDSADNSTFAAISGMAFTAISVNTPTGERVQSTTLTTTIRRYVRIATSGTFSNFVFAVGFVRYLTARDP